MPAALACAGSFAHTSNLSNFEVTGAPTSLLAAIVMLAVPLDCNISVPDGWLQLVACRVTALEAQRAIFEASEAGASCSWTIGVQSSFDTTGASKSFCKCPSETCSSFSPSRSTPFSFDGADWEPRGDRPGPSFNCFSRCSCSCCLSLLTHLSSRFFPLPGLLLRSYPLGLRLSFAASCSHPHSFRR
jgi:hypothetical protein